MQYARLYHSDERIHLFAFTRMSFLIYIFFLERLLNFKVLLKHDDAVISYIVVDTIKICK